MTLATKIRDKIATGVLPRHDPPKLWVGKGNGRPCDGCDSPITDVENEFDTINGSVLRFHPACYHIWDVERA